LKTPRTKMTAVDFDLAQPAQEPAAFVARHGRAAGRVIEATGFGIAFDGLWQCAGAGAFDRGKDSHPNGLAADAAADA